MIYLIFLAELIFLFILSHTLSKTLSFAFYKLFRSQKITIYLVAVIFFPGVVIHEISHWLMAQVLFVPTGKVEFLPQLRGSELKLGSVAVAQTDPFRRALIGVAPFLIGTTVLLASLFLYPQLPLIPNNIKIFVVGYVIFEIGNTMFSSRKDLEGTIELLLALLIIGVALYLIGIRIPSIWLEFFTTNNALMLARQASFFIAFPIILDFCIIFFLRLLLRLGR